MALQIKRGLTADLPQSAADGELLFATDTNKLYVGNGGTPQEVTGGGSTGGDSVLDSALIGDVFIINNTIAGVDAYGNPDTLVVDSDLLVSSIASVADLNVSVDTRSTTTISYTAAQLGDGNWSHLGTMYGDMTGKQISAYSFMGSTPTDILNSFVPGDKLTFKIYDSMSMQYVDYTVTLTSPFVYSMNQGGYVASVLEANTGMMSTSFDTNSDPVIVKTVSTGELNSYAFGADGTLVTPSLISDSALIGDVSIVGNTIATLDSYGNPGELNVSATDVVFDSNFNLGVNSFVETNETVTAEMGNNFSITTSPGTPYFRYDGQSDWLNASKFVNGSVITAIGMGNSSVVIQLTSDMTYTGMASGWTASYTAIGSEVSGSFSNISSVTVANTYGAVTNYGFDDQGIFTAPRVSTTELLINGSAPGLLTINQDGSKSVVVDTENTVTETLSAGGASLFQFTSGSINYNGGSPSFDTTKLVTGTIISASGMSGPFVAQLTSDFVYTMMSGSYSANLTIISGSIGPSSSVSSITVTNTSGSTTNYDFTEAGFIAESALIGDVSIAGNTIAALDSYGNPDTLNVSASDIVIDSNLNLTVDTTEIITYTVSNFSRQFEINFSGASGAKFKIDEISSWADASKFVNGSQVTLTDSMYGTYVIRLTSGLTYSMMDGMSASFEVISGPSSGGSPRSYTVTVANTTGDIANYGFNDQGTLTAPAISTNSLLINGSVPGLLTINQDGSKSVVVDTENTVTETLTAGGASSFYIETNSIRFSGGSPSFDVTKLVTGTIISASGMSGPVVIQLTSDFAYSMMVGGYAANSTIISGSVGAGSSVGSVTISNTTGSTANYDFTEAGFIAQSALIGDVSIVGNTIATLDSYGNPIELNVSASDVVFDSNFNLGVNTLTETTETVSGGSNRFRAIMYSPYEFTFENYDSGWTGASKFVTGSIVTITDYMNSSTAVIQLTSNLVFGGMATGWIANFQTISNPSGTSSVQAYSVSVQNTSGSVANYGFNDQGTLSAPAISTNSMLINGVAIADSALIGDVSIVGNTIAGLNAYGLADKLVVDGDLEVTGNLIIAIPEYASVGSYIFAMNTSGQIVNDQLYAGSSLRAAGGTTFTGYYPDDYGSWSYTAGGDPLPGTWKAMGRANGQQYGLTLFIRIA